MRHNFLISQQNTIQNTQILSPIQSILQNYHLIKHKTNMAENTSYTKRGDKPYHGHLQGRFEGELRDEDRVIGKLCSNFRIEKLLAFGEHIRDFAYPSLELSDGVVAAHPDGVLFAAPLHRQHQLLVRRR